MALTEKNYVTQIIIDSLMQQHLPNGLTSTAINHLHLFKATQHTRCDASVYKPSLIITVQGCKNLCLYGENQDFSAGECLISSIDMPITSKIVAASEAKPYFSLVLELDLTTVASVMAELKMANQRIDSEILAVTINPVSCGVLEAMKRMIDLLNSPDDIPVLYPLLEREIIYRLLTSPIGSRLKHLCTLDTSSNKVMRAVKYLNEHFQRTIRIESLAHEVNMSVSSLHQHFKTLTSLSPLQFQKQLRLFEARKLIMQGVDISSAAYQVGYESTSQFSRDYGRAFGLAPSKDRTAQLNIT